MKAHIDFCHQTNFLDVVFNFGQKKRGILSCTGSPRANVLHTCRWHREWSIGRNASELKTRTREAFTRSSSTELTERDKPPVTELKSSYRCEPTAVRDTAEQPWPAAQREGRGQMNSNLTPKLDHSVSSEGENSVSSLIKSVGHLSRTPIPE